MTSSKQETQRQAILHFWKQGIRNAIEIQSSTKIPISTVRRNLKKIQDTGDVKHKGGPIPKDRGKIFAWGGFV